MMRKLFLAILSITMTGCYGRDTLHIFSPDRSQCITVMDQGEKRYIIAGKKDKIPNTGYVSLDMTGVDDLGDVIHLCWDTEQNGWEMVIHNSKIIESKLDSAKYDFMVSLPTDDRGIPNEKKFREKNCAIYSYYMRRLTPDDGGAIIEQ